MIENFNKVIASQRFLGLKPDIREYRWRFLLQKITYLAQALGVNTDYNFTIYASGPYSPALTTDYYTQANALASLQTDYNLTQEDIRHLEKIRECCNLHENLSLIEATSTIVYIMKELSNLTDDDIFVSAKSFKPFLSDSLLVIGMTKAKQLLFKQEYLTEELKQEMDVWDRIES